MAETPSHFFKVVLPSSLEDKKLDIPEMFVRKFGDELSIVATLTVPNGRAWKVGLIKDGRKIWFHDGWQEFMEYHSIRAGYFLVFKYTKNSDFHVLIFDMTACEVNYTCNGKDASNDKKYSTHQDELATEDSPTPNLFFRPLRNKLFRDCPSRRPYREMRTLYMENQAKQIEEMKIKKHKMEGMVVNGRDAKYNERSSLHCKRHRSKSVENFAPSPLVQDMDKSSRTKFQRTKHNGEDKHRTNVLIYKGELKNDANEVGTHSSEGDNKISILEENELLALLEEMGICFTRRHGYITAEERERAVAVAKFLKPKKPSFMAILRSSGIRTCRVYVPFKFASTYLRNVGKYVKLHYSDGTESVAEMTWYDGRCFIRKGWGRTSIHKNLEAGDICNFELVSMKDVVFKVSVFHASKSK